MPEIYFNGPVGQIEARYTLSEDVNAPIALILHPHPLHGGTMNNKLTYHLFHSFVKCRFTVMRINMPGVGKSAGSFTNGQMELQVGSVALDWLRSHNPEAEYFWVGGVSFGTWIAMSLASRRPEIEGFICIAPPAASYDFSFSIPCPASGLVLQGDRDVIANINDTNTLVENWRKQRANIIDYEIIPGADHFFTNHLEELDNICYHYINTRIAMRIVKPVRKKRRRRRKRDRGEDEFD